MSHFVNCGLRVRYEGGGDVSPTAFVTEGGWSGAAYGTMRVGDLAYQLNDQQAFFLHPEGQRLLLAGVASFADFLSFLPYRLIPPDVLFIEISVLRGFYLYFDLTLHSKHLSLGLLTVMMTSTAV
jgi:hypothetical protein